MRIEAFAPDEISVSGRARARLDEEAVGRLMESIRQIGLREPPTVRVDLEKDEILLIAGLHRVEACKRLGWSRIECEVWDGSEVDARLWEIAENLHRAELTVQERADHIAEWVKLTDEKVKAQVAPLTKPHDRGRPNQGINAAVRELGIDRTEAQRAVKIAGISEEAKAAAREAHLDDNQSALLAAAKEAGPEAQVAKVREIAERRAVKPAPAIMNSFETEEAWRGAMNRVWNRGSAEWRERWLSDAESPVFDNTRSGRAA